MDKKTVMATLPAAMVGVCAAAMGQYQGTADQPVPQAFQTQRFGSAPLKPLFNKRTLLGGQGEAPLGGGGGGSGGPGLSCAHLNGGPLDDFGAPASQKDADPPFAFFAEAADDFVLVDPDDPDGTNPCG